MPIVNSTSTNSPADINGWKVFNGSKVTQLHNAALVNDVVTVISLLNEGADPTIKTVDSTPRTALELADRYMAKDVSEAIINHIKDTGLEYSDSVFTYSPLVVEVSNLSIDD